MADTRFVQIGDKVLHSEDDWRNPTWTGKIEGVRGPNIDVEWQAATMTEWCYYKIFDLTWSDLRGAWVLDAGAMGQR